MCGNFDAGDFKAKEMCCGCYGGNQCRDLDNGALDSDGKNCLYYTEAADGVSRCGTKDDTDFIANEMCCTCSGGDICAN